MDPNSLHVVVLRGDRQGEQKTYYQKAYELWKNVWEATFRELDNYRGKLPSDDFTRQHEIFTLFNKDQCIALICIRYMETDNPAVWSDSYFKPWPKEAKEAFRFGKNLLIASYITVHPEYRGRTGDISVKELLVHASLEYVLRTRDLDGITGIVRDDKAMDRLLYECGAVPLVKGVLYHNVPVDLVGLFPKKYPTGAPDRYMALIDKLLEGATIDTTAEAA